MKGAILWLLLGVFCFVGVVGCSGSSADDPKDTDVVDKTDVMDKADVVGGDDTLVSGDSEIVEDIPNACEAGTFDHDGNPDTDCVAWSDCVPGQYVRVAGTGTSDRICAPCAPGTYSTEANQAECTPWVECVPGEYVDVAGTVTSDQTCESCPEETYTSEANQEECSPWVVECEPGEYESAPSTAIHDRICLPCADGMYSTEINQQECQPWSDCAEETEYLTEEPTASSDRVCALCPAGSRSAFLNASACDGHVGMVTVPAGAFIQGCNETVDNACKPYEYPPHEVNVPAFEIDTYEVTVEAYKACVDDRYCNPPSYSNTDDRRNWQRQEDRMDYPMNAISWPLSRMYCRWAGKRLCSESEWEKAARGTDGRLYPWGNEPATCEYAVMRDTNDIAGCGENKTLPVGTRPKGISPYGAYDMAGNVQEWTEDDCYTDNQFLPLDYEGAPTDGSPWVVAEENQREPYRIMRGGYYGAKADEMRTSHRTKGARIDQPISYGFRCCNSL